MRVPQMAEVHKRLASMVAEANLGLDATSKSLRAYTTHAHPALLERLRQHYPSLGPGRSKVGKTFTYEYDIEGLSGSQLLNHTLQPAYEQEAIQGREVDVIYPKTSKKTLSGPETDLDTMRQQIEAWVEDYASPKDNTARFRDLVAEELGERTTCDLFDNFANSKLANGILQHLQVYGGSFPASRPVHVEGRASPLGGLTMKCKYYAGRDDNRAYCQDRHRLRLLTGACLHRLIHPKKMSIRKKLHISQVLRPKGKDELRLVVPKASHGKTTILITGDISNFTGSFANSWLLLFVAALDLSSNLRSKFSPISVGSSFLYATWFELFAVYLYLTVGADCYVEDIDRYETLPGGFLGVTANITSGLLCLSVLMIDLTRRLLPQVYYTQCQAGGDDFAFLIVVNEKQAEYVVKYIRRDMETHVGLLKEFSVTRTDDTNEGVIDGILFCRKRVTLTRSATHTIIGHEPSCPLPESILPMNIIKRHDLQVSAWRELDLGLLRYEESCPHMLPLTDALRSIFLDKYPRVRPVRTRATRFWPPFGLSGGFHLGVLMSDKVKEVVDAVERVDMLSTHILVSVDTKLRHLQVQEVIVSFDVMYKGSKFNAYILPQEECTLQVERWEEFVSVQPSNETKRSFLKLIEA